MMIYCVIRINDSLIYLPFMFKINNKWQLSLAPWVWTVDYYYDKVYRVVV